MPRPSELDIHLPEPVRLLVQPFLRWVLLNLSGYQVKIEGELPKDPSILAIYPHGEHANHILLPPQNIVVLAAADHWYANILRQLATIAVVDGIPVTRTEAPISQRRHELAVQSGVLEKRKKHLAIYPQGTRSGPVGSAHQLRQEMQRGVAILAHHHNKPTYPIGLVYPPDYQPHKGGVGAWQNMQQRFRGGGRTVPVTVRIGEPIEPPRRSHAAFEQFLNILAHELFRLAR